MTVWSIGLVLGTTDWRKFVKVSTAALMILLILMLGAIAPSSALAARKGFSAVSDPAQSSTKSVGKLTEVAPPATILELRQAFEENQPQVSILSPKPNEVLQDDRVAVQFQVKDLPIFKDENLDLGPHLHVLLDNQTYQAVYDISKPVVFKDLQPGTHTLRAFASRPWHESFKNDGAYVQTYFHIFTKTQENIPDLDLPLLTFSRPQGRYGAEPVMLDFHLSNAPLHLVAREDAQDDIPDWRIRCTVNGNSFILDQWQPIYLKGFKPGKNWIQLEFLDESGNLVKNLFNNTARMIVYEPGGKDTLSKLVRGELSATLAQGIVDPTYKLPIPTPETVATPEPAPLPTASPAVTPTVTPIAKPSPTPSPATQPMPVPIAPSAQPKVQATPQPNLPEAQPPAPPQSSAAPSVKSVVPESAPTVPLPTPKAESPKAPEPVAPKPIAPKPVAPRVIKPAAPIPAPIKPAIEQSEPSVDTPSLPTPAKPSDRDNSKALQEVQEKITKKAIALKSEFLTQFNKLREKIRPPAQTQPAQTAPAPATSPVASPVMPAVPGVSPSPSASVTPIPAALTAEPATERLVESPTEPLIESPDQP